MHCWLSKYLWQISYKCCHSSCQSGCAWNINWNDIGHKKQKWHVFHLITPSIGVMSIWINNMKNRGKVFSHPAYIMQDNNGIVMSLAYLNPHSINQSIQTSTCMVPFRGPPRSRRNLSIASTVWCKILVIYVMQLVTAVCYRTASSHGMIPLPVKCDQLLLPKISWDSLVSP